MANTTQNPFAYFNYANNPQVRTFLDQNKTQYNAFTGSDITAYIGHTKIGSLQGITCSITREIMPVYTTGDPNFKTVTKGKRGIAGNLVFTQFDKHAILRNLQTSQQNANQTLLDIWQQLNQNVVTTVPNGLSTTDQPWVSAIKASDSNFQDAVNKEILETYYLVGQRLINYVDQIPPFDVTITMVNEEGRAAVVSIRGVQLINEAWGYTLDDLTSEAAYTYIAREVNPLDAIADISQIQSHQ